MLYMSYYYLALAIIGELIGSYMLKSSKLYPTIGVINIVILNLFGPGHGKASNNEKASESSIFASNKTE